MFRVGMNEGRVRKMQNQQYGFRLPTNSASYSCPVSIIISLRIELSPENRDTLFMVPINTHLKINLYLHIQNLKLNILTIYS